MRLPSPLILLLAPIAASALATRAHATTCADPPPTHAGYAGFYGSTINPTGDPLGGGYGYYDIGWPAPGDAIVDDIGALLVQLALARSTPGPDRIWLNPAGSFDFTPYLPSAPFDVPDDTTLLSLRGTGVYGAPEGALLRASTNFHGALFQAGVNTRFYGLRFQGPSTSAERVEPTASAILHGPNQSFDPPVDGGLEVDNCEFWGWTLAGVDVRNRTGAFIHHSYFHDNLRDGLGYGVAFGDGAQGRVIGNLFNNNRHAIAADGRDTGYEAAWNTVMGDGTEQSFDTHGIVDRCDDDKEKKNDECKPGFPISDAGLWLYIHHNTFLFTGDPTITVRGVVRDCAWIENNEFGLHYHWGGNTTLTDPGAVYVRYVDSSVAAHVLQENNHYDWSGLVWSSGGAMASQSLFADASSAASILYGDFDGDGRDDLFRIDEHGHWRFRFSAIPAAGWTDMDVRVPGLAQSQIAVGDFDGDGTDDLFYTDGSRWHYFKNGSGALTDLAASSLAFGALRFGRFDGDKKTDVFKIDHGQWWFSSGGATTAWTPLASLPGALAELRFGNFVGDRRSDVFRVVGGIWWVSDAARGEWQQLNPSAMAGVVSDLRFADLDGDGKTDVFSTYVQSHSAQGWRMSHGGAAPWTLLRAIGPALARLGFADINGDHKTDILYLGSK